MKKKKEEKNAKGENNTKSEKCEKSKNKTKKSGVIEFKKRKRDDSTSDIEVIPEPKKQKLEFARSSELNESEDFFFGNNLMQHYNLKTNKELRTLIFGKEIPIKCNIYAFTTLDSLLFHCDNDRISVVQFELIKGSFCYMIGEPGFIQELMTLEQNFCHEFIMANPVKMFVDIDWELDDLDKPKFDIGLNNVHLFIEEFMRKFEKFLESPELKLSELKHSWLILQACRDSKDNPDKKSKISFHLINNSTSKRIPIFFKSISQMMYIIQEIKSQIMIPTNQYTIDDTFNHNNKGLRLTGNAYRREVSRIFFPDKKFHSDLIEKLSIECECDKHIWTKVEHSKLLEDSRIQITEENDFYLVLDVKEEHKYNYHEIKRDCKPTNKRNKGNQKNGDFKFEKTKAFNENKLKKNKFGVSILQGQTPIFDQHRMSLRNNESISIPKILNEMGQLIIDEVVKILKENKEYSTGFTTYNFEHISCETKYKVYKMRVSFDKTKIAIGIQSSYDSKINKCLLNNHNHHSKNAMRLFINNDTDDEDLFSIDLWCSGGSHDGHKNTKLVVNNVNPAKNFELMELCKNFFNKIRDCE
jgi:hypothetical protein